MARRLNKLLTRTAVALAAACACGGALADPVSIIAIAAYGASAAGVIAATTATLIGLGAGLLSSAQARRKQRKAAAAAKSASNASLQDRTQTVLSTEAPWQTIYGQPAPIAGSVAAMLTTGDRDQWRHVVIVFAAHECEAIDEVYIEGQAIGALDGDGWATTAPWAESKGDQTADVTVTFDANGNATVPGVLMQELLAATDPNPTGALSLGAVTGLDTVFVSTAYAGRTVRVGYGATRWANVVVPPNGALSTGGAATIDVQYFVPGGGGAAEVLRIYASPTEAAVLGTVADDGNITSRLRISTAGGSTAITGGRPNGSATISYRYGTYSRYVRIAKHLSPGGVDTVDQQLLALLPDQWTPAHRLSGCTYIVLTLALDLQRFQSGLPNVTARLRGKKVYDPRTGATAYSRNPALCLADFIRSEVGYGASAAQVDAAQLVVAANACDVEVWTPYPEWTDLGHLGASKARYVCDGAFSSAQDREQTRQQLEDAMAGASHESGGVWRIQAGAWSTPVMSLTDDDMLAPVEVQQASTSGSQRYNGARGSYINQAGTGVSDDIVPYQNPNYRALDGKDRWQDLSFPFTGGHARCYQLARVRTELSRGGMVIKVSPKMSAWRLQPGDRLLVTCAVFGIVAKAFRVQDWSYSTASPLALLLVEDEESFYDLVEDGSADPSPNTVFPDPFAAPARPATLYAASGTGQLLIQGGAVVVRTNVYVPAAADARVTQGGAVEVQWRRQGDGDVWQSVLFSGDSTGGYLLGTPEGQTIIIRTRYVTSIGIPSDWTSWPHYVIGKTEPPPAVTGVALSQDRVFFAELDRLAVPDLDGYLVRAVPGAVPQWSLGVELHQGVVTDSPWFLPQRLYGINTVMVAARDTSGNVGAMGWDTLDFGQADTSAALQVVDFGPRWPGTVVNASVQGGALQANLDASSGFYKRGERDIYYRDGAPGVYSGDAFLPMVYIARFSPLYGGGAIRLNSTITGSRVAIEYRIDGNPIGNFYATSSVYGATTDVYGSSPDWQPWLGELRSTRGISIQIRVSIDGGTQQGVLSMLQAALVMPLVSQVFPERDVPAGGARLNRFQGLPGRNWITVQSVTPAVANDGGTGVTSRYSERDSAAGPLVQILNSSGVAVAGRASALVHGFEDALS
jgi:hypothetical protein